MKLDLQSVLDIVSILSEDVYATGSSPAVVRTGDVGAALNRRLVTILLLTVGGAGAPVSYSAIIGASPSQVQKLPESHEPDLSPSVLTSDLVKKFLATQDALRKLELRRPPGPIPSFVGDVALARAFEADPDAKRIFPEVGWSALEYARTQSAIVNTLTAIDDLDAGRTRRLPDDIAPENVAFLRSVPVDISVEFTRWRRINWKAPRGQ